MADVSFFKANGYQLIKGFFPRDAMVSVSEFLQQEKEKTLDRINQFIPFDSEQDLINKTVELTEDTEKFKHLSSDLKQWLSGHYPLEVRLSPLILSLTECPNISDLYTSIYPGEDPKVHLPPVIRFVLPKNRHAAVPPHQDVSYNKHLEDFFVIWTPFTSINDERGGVEVFPGTQALPERIQNLDRQFWLKGVEVEGEPIHFQMEVGDVLLLNPFIVHQSRANNSDEVRISGDFRLFSGNSTKHSMNLLSRERIAPAPA